MKKEITLGKLIRITNGKRHAIYESSVGEVRKPLNEEHRKKPI